MGAQPIVRFDCAVVAEDGARAEFRVRAGQTLLAALNAQGSKAIPIGCRNGGCGVCRVEILEGEYERQRMSRKHVTEEEEAAGYALACRVVPKSDLVMRLAKR